jgi:hypothetical protein
VGTVQVCEENFSGLVMDGKTVTYIGSGFGQLKTGLSSIESQCRGLNQLTQPESKGVLREVMIWGWQYYFQR